MLHTYSQDILDLFKSALKGDKKAFNALMTTEKCPELAAFSNAIKGDEHAGMWLKARGSKDLQLICRALNDDKLALKLLKLDENKFSVSFVLACQNRVEGKYWLSKNDYSHFLPICETIAETMKTKDWEQVLYRIFG